MTNIKKKNLKIPLEKIPYPPLLILVRKAVNRPDKVISDLVTLLDERDRRKGNLNKRKSFLRERRAEKNALRRHRRNQVERRKGMDRPRGKAFRE